MQELIGKYKDYWNNREIFMFSKKTSHVA